MENKDGTERDTGLARQHCDERRDQERAAADDTRQAERGWLDQARQYMRADVESIRELLHSKHLNNPG